MRVLTRPDRNGPPVWRPIINHTVFKAEDQVKKKKKKKELENRRRPAEHGQGRNAMIRLRGAKRRRNERERERERDSWSVTWRKGVKSFLLFRERRWSHGDSRHVYSTMIINRLLYAVQRTATTFFRTVTVRLLLAEPGMRKMDRRTLWGIQKTRYTCWLRFVQDRAPHYGGYYSS